jgi:dihydroflavonol-4-reductase
MNVLITGATGLIGNAIAKRLASERHRVRALARDTDRAASVLPSGVELVRGDVTDLLCIRAAVRDVELVFHAAGLPEQWQRDELIFDRVNRQGTVNVVNAALEEKVRRVVYTSTMDVFAAPPGDTLVETNMDEQPKHTAYERSKQAAEREVEKIRAAGLDVVYVNPSAVYGPGPSQTGLNGFFVRLLRGKVPMLPPGGMSIVYVDNVTDAHVAAAERGVNGERYLVSDGHATTKELAETIVREAGFGKVPPVGPAWLLKPMASISAVLGRAFGLVPLISPGELSFVLWNANADASKARLQFGLTATPLAEGVRRTIAFLRTEGILA